METRLSDLASLYASAVAKRLFAEYGAAFLTKATPPPTVIFADSEAVEAFQTSVEIRRALLGEYEIELQADAMDWLLAASDELAADGVLMSARAADSGRRSYDETMALWARKVGRGLEHWQEQGRMSAAEAAVVRSYLAVEQVAIILDLEARQELFFGTFFNRSILYSVAAPGASQHLSMLAFDVAEYQDERIEQSLNRHGWHRTVLHDLPHFTYLGYAVDELPSLGLRQVTQSYGDFNCRFWVPDLE